MHRKNNGDPILRSNPRYLFAFPLSGVLRASLCRLLAFFFRVSLARFWRFFFRVSRTDFAGRFFLMCFPDRLRAPSLPYVFSGPPSRSASSLMYPPGRLHAPFLPLYSPGRLRGPPLLYVLSGPPSRPVFSFAPAAAESAMYGVRPVSTIINPAPPVNANPRFSSHSQRARPRLPAQKRIYFCHFE